MGILGDIGQNVVATSDVASVNEETCAKCAARSTVMFFLQAT